ncbi:unnamed protein product, partial [Brenthis ino]
MTFYYYIAHLVRLLILLNIILEGKAQNVLDTVDVPIKFSGSDFYFISGESNSNENEKVDIKLYYECLCPYCIAFYKNEFRETVEKLSQYLNIHTYPYGNAKTIIKNENITFICQHGRAECYGNKLHACTIDNFQNITKAIIFNACMMDENRGSDDTAADKCALLMNLDSRPIKECAKGIRGTELLQYNGEESKKVGFHFVPYILINDQLSKADNFMENVCSAFTVLPPPCVDFLRLYK